MKPNDNLSISISREWSQEHADFVRKQLATYNARHVSEEIRGVYEPISFTLKDESGQILGGVIGAVKWSYVKIDFLWVDDALRGQGYGKSLLEEVERKARERGCDSIEVDTFSFQAPEFYKKQGFEVVGVVDHAPRGHQHYYLIKKLHVGR